MREHHDWFWFFHLSCRILSYHHFCQHCLAVGGFQVTMVSAHPMSTTRPERSPAATTAIVALVKSVMLGNRQRLNSVDKSDDRRGTIVTGIYEYREMEIKRSTRAMKSLLQETGRFLTRLSDDSRARRYRLQWFLPIRCPLPDLNAAQLRPRP
jgi:hypothetical protein